MVCLGLTWNEGGVLSRLLLTTTLGLPPVKFSFHRSTLEGAPVERPEKVERGSFPFGFCSQVAALWDPKVGVSGSSPVAPLGSLSSLAEPLPSPRFCRQKNLTGSGPRVIGCRGTTLLCQHLPGPPVPHTLSAATRPCAGEVLYI